jgi:allantoin racemase
MTSALYVINPNSTTSVTDGIDAALAPLRAPGMPDIRCITLQQGPAGVQTQRQIDDLISPLCARVQALEKDASAFVIACFSDPGLYSVREITSKPVLGIAECGVLTALTLGQRFGVISILQASVPRHLRYYGAMGVDARLAGDLPIGMGVAELSDQARTLAKMIAVGKTLREQHGADVLVMGCAGMAAFRRPLQRAVGIPVVEPTQATVSMALGRIQLAWEA